MLRSRRVFLLGVLLLVSFSGCASLEDIRSGGGGSPDHEDQGANVRDLDLRVDVDNHDPDPADEALIRVYGYDNSDREAYRFAGALDLVVKSMPKYAGEEPKVVHRASVHTTPDEFRANGQDPNYVYKLDNTDLPGEGGYRVSVSVTFDTTGHTYDTSASFSYPSIGGST